MGTIAEKLEYLDGTREKILTETNRLGVGLTEQDKFRDYAKGLHDGYVDLLNNGTDTLYDNMEKVSGSGSDITLENTEEAPMKSEFEGDTYQETTTGKNLWGNVSYSTTHQGITFSYNQNGTITANGTSTNTATSISVANAITNNVYVKLEAGTYTASCENLVKGVSLQIYDTNSNSKNSTFTLTETTNIILRLIVASGITLNNYIFKLMLEKGSTPTEYEEYTGGQPSPNPDYPQPINVVSGRQEVSVVGKNYFDNTIQPMISDNNITTSTIDTGKKLVWGGSSSSNYKFVVFAIMDLTNYVGKTIRFKCNFTASGSNIPQVNIGLCNADGSNRTSKASTKISGQTISFVVPTLVGEQKYLSLLLYINELGTLALNDYVEFTNMILTIDNEDMAYEEYKGQSYEINLGKNLFDINSTATTLGIEYSFDGSELSLNGTTTNAGNIYNNNNNTILLKSGTYTFSTTTSGTFTRNGKDVAIYLRKKSDSSSVVELFSTQGYIIQQTFTINEDTELYMQLYTNGSGFVFDDFKIYLMLEKGSQATSYTPYKTPIELCKIGNYQDFIKKGTGKNLFDKDNINSINAYINGSTMKFASSGTVKTYYISCKPNTTYTISKITSNQFRVGTSSDIPVIDGSILQFWQDNSATQHTITTDSNAKYLCVCIYNSSGATITEQEVLNSLQIEEGTTATSYEPYNSKGTWYIEKQIGKVVLNGSENLNKASTTLVDRFTLGISGINALGYSNYFTIVSNFNANVGTMFINEYKTILYMNYSSYGTTTLEQFKTWLGTHNTTVYYVLSTPTTTEITDSELISQLEEFYNAKSSKNVTYISVTSEYLPAILNVIAIKKYE